MKTSGFTLIELIVTITILAVLSIAFASRFLTKTSFDSLGFYQQAQGVTRYAQKIAMAQRTNVFVSIAANRVRACYDLACATPLPAPGGGEVSTGSADNAYAGPNSVSVSPVTTIQFNGLGQPLDSGGSSLGAALVVTVSGDINRQFTVERETGYVHP